MCWAFPKADLAVPTAECPICQQQRLTLSRDMAPFLRVMSQLACGSPWNTSIMERCSILVFEIGTYTVDIDLPSLHGVLLPKLPSMALYTSLSTLTVFHALLLLIKELTSQETKCGSGPTLLESTGLTMFSIPKQPAWQDGRMAF